MVELGVDPTPGKMIATELTIESDREDVDKVPVLKQLNAPEAEGDE